MKPDVKINHSLNDIDNPGVYGLTQERMDVNKKFLHSLFERVKKASENGNGYSKSFIIEAIVEHASTNVEAVLLMNFFQENIDRMNAKCLNGVEALVNVLQKIGVINKADVITKGDLSDDQLDALLKSIPGISKSDQKPDLN